MKRNDRSENFNKKTKGLIKGSSSGVLISAAIHLILLAIAGGFVVFQAVKKPEAKFVPPPPVERPKVELKKPRVKVKKSVRPKATQRITSKAVQSMPNIQLPEIASAGTGLSGGIGGFELMPDLSQVTLFGGSQSVSVGNDFEGTFYSFLYDRQGRRSGVNYDMDFFVPIFKKFIEYDWNPRVFAMYYRSPQKLYTTHFMIPVSPSYLGPRSFGKNDTSFEPSMWFVHYKGKIASRTGGKYRFWGVGDFIMIVKVGDEIVLDASWDYMRGQITGWSPSDRDDRRFHLGKEPSTIGDWFELKPGEPVDMQVLLADDGGEEGRFGFYLLVQDASDTYEKNEFEGAPILPVFKVAEFPERVKAEIEYGTIRDELDLDSPLMFNVH